MGKTLLALSVGLALGLMTPAQALAETGSSSWVQRTIPHRPAAPRPITGTQRRSVKGLPSTVAPQEPRRPKIPLGKTLVAPTGDNAAYIAFDQGQYITALKLAEAQAKKNDPQAHTLLGRLYAEGLGVPRNELTAAKWYRRGAELGDVEAMFAFGVILAS
ncbi:MAG: tetratricopeptide repeat protein, partial [Pseudomonadota bacterium]